MKHICIDDNFEPTGKFCVACVEMQEMDTICHDAILPTKSGVKEMEMDVRKNCLPVLPAPSDSKVSELDGITLPLFAIALTSEKWVNPMMLSALAEKCYGDGLQNSLN